MKIKTALLSLAVMAGVFSISQAQAQQAQIDWGLGPQSITGDSDVSTEGTLVAAYAFGDNSAVNVTVNGVTFQGLTVPAGSNITFGDYDLASTAGNLNAYSNLSSQELPYGSLSPEYQTLLGSGGSAANPGTLVLTLGGLVVGQQYIFQFWTSNSPLAVATSGNRFDTTATANSAIALVDNMTDTDGDMGQFGTGTFIAAATSETVVFSGTNGSNDPLINAFELRAVPEPSSAVLLVFGLLSGCYVFRRHRRA